MLGDEIFEVLEYFALLGTSVSFTVLERVEYSAQPAALARSLL